MTTLTIGILAYILGALNGALICQLTKPKKIDSPIGKKVHKVLMKQRTKPWK